jgi:hypothetical protein
MTTIHPHHLNRQIPVPSGPITHPRKAVSIRPISSEHRSDGHINQPMHRSTANLGKGAPTPAVRGRRWPLRSPRSTTWSLLAPDPGHFMILRDGSPRSRPLPTPGRIRCRVVVSSTSDFRPRWKSPMPSQAIAGPKGNHQETHPTRRPPSASRRSSCASGGCGLPQKIPDLAVSTRSFF